MAQGTRSNEEIHAEMAAARERLGSNLEGLITQVHPKAVAARTVHDVKALVAAEVSGVKAQFIDEAGSVQIGRVAALAVAAVGTVALLVVLRSTARRGRR
ncbi:MAG: DUF3618 domain-containing protein [Propioniciclava sp.]